MEARVARLEAIIPTLATKEDLVRVELKLEQTIRTEITAVHQEISGIYREIGNVHKDMGSLRGEIGNLRGEMGNIEKTVATLVIKAMIAMVTISTALSTFAFMFAGK
jgi:predicted RNase H-like nuclease (RuvC/YqgF family)